MACFNSGVLRNPRRRINAPLERAEVSKEFDRAKPPVGGAREVAKTGVMRWPYTRVGPTVQCLDGIDQNAFRIASWYLDATKR